MPGWGWESKTVCLCCQYKIKYQLSFQEHVVSQGWFEFQSNFSKNNTLKLHSYRNDPW